MRSLLVVLYLLLTACSAKEDGITFDGTLPGVIPTGPLVNKFAETTPVLWNGNLVFVLADRTGSEGHAIQVIDASGTVLGSGPVGLGLISAIVEGGTLYVIGATDWSRENQLVLTSTTDLTTWTAPRVIKTATRGWAFFNTSIARDPNGFVLAYETCESGRVCFSARFAHSRDLTTWRDIGGPFADTYTACPTIRYLNDYYYVFILVRHQGKFVTAAARSKDLKNWTASKLKVLAPEALDNRSINASDLDFVEVNGKLEIVWINGDQVSWGNTERARYDGSFTDFVRELF